MVRDSFSPLHSPPPTTTCDSILPLVSQNSTLPLLRFAPHYGGRLPHGAAITTALPTCWTGFPLQTSCMTTLRLQRHSWVALWAVCLDIPYTAYLPPHLFHFYA